MKVFVFTLRHCVSTLIMLTHFTTGETIALVSQTGMAGLWGGNQLARSMVMRCRAISFDKVGDFAASVRDYSAVISLEPQNVNAYYSVHPPPPPSLHPSTRRFCPCFCFPSLSGSDAWCFFSGRGFALDNMGQGEAASLDYRQALEIEESAAKQP